MSLAAVAKRFGVTVKTVRRWVRGVGGRQLETAKLGGKRYTSLEAIQRFSQQGMTQKRLKFDPQGDEKDILPLFAAGKASSSRKTRDRRK